HGASLSSVNGRSSWALEWASKIKGATYFLDAEGIHRLGSDVGENAFSFRVQIKGFERQLPAEARLLVTAEGQARKRGDRVVDHDDPRFQLFSDPVRTAVILGPHRGCQAVDGIVGLLNDFFFIAEL